MNDSARHKLPDLQPAELDNLPEDGGPHYNRLVFQKSPYLLQHATNPIDWRPWSPASLEQARMLDRPVFLSIGYSTCHWCHVMADESFSDPDVARILNQFFIPIKVDREERPDIDATYMQACQLMTGSGGWPLTIVLTPDLHPFFAATYLPKNDRHGMIGLTTLLQRIHDAWTEQRQQIDETGQEVFIRLQNSERTHPGDFTTDDSAFRNAFKQYESEYDPVFAGFGTAPKFPAPHNISLLLRLAQRLDRSAAADMALDTLRSIRFGGIYDQLGGGIHRYSVDERWLVPHFEKMLYDQALLVTACTDAWQYGGDEFFREMGRDVANYVLRDLTSPEGGFFCGEDADSEGSEGTCYLWSIDEFEKEFAKPDAARLRRHFGLRENGNFEGKNILYLPEGLNGEDLELCRSKLLPIRKKRVQPHLDDKIITAWNGLMIAALARLGDATGDERMIRAARDCVDFIKSGLVDRSDSRLMRRWRTGEAAVKGFLEDYAALIWGLLELYRARFRPDDLVWALQLADVMVDLFSDQQGIFYDTGKDAETILVRGRNLQDGAMPSGNGLAALVLIRLGILTGRVDLTDKGERLLQNNWGLVSRYPAAFSVSLLACDHLLGPSPSMAVASASGEFPSEMINAAKRGYRPRLELLLLDNISIFQDIVPIAKDKKPLQGRPTAWVCRQRTCLEPLHDPEELAGILDASG